MNCTIAPTPVPCTFDASTSTGAAPLSYAWNFGDSTTSNSGPTTTHNYSCGAPFGSGTLVPVMLTVTDSLSRTASISKNVTVVRSGC
jgi:hypothetical protein